MGKSTSEQSEQTILLGDSHSTAPGLGGPQLLGDSQGTAPVLIGAQLPGDSHSTTPGRGGPQLLGDSHGTAPGPPGPQSPQAECYYLARRCRQMGLDGCGYRTWGCHPAGRFQWRALGCLQRKGQVRDPQAGVDSATPLAESPRNPSFITEGTAATVGQGSGPDPTPVPPCSPRTPERDASYTSSPSLSPTPQHGAVVLFL